MKSGDAFVCNDAYLAGGTHLPDISIITPVFFNGEIRFFIACVGHHSDVGGAVPGSISPNSATIFEEGIRIPPVKILREGVYDPGIFKAFFLAGGPGSGKTFVTRSAFGGTGLKLVNSDAVFERGLKKAGLSLKMPDEEEYFRNLVRAKAKMSTATSLDTYVQATYPDLRKAINLTQQNVVAGVLQKPQDGDQSQSDWMLNAIEMFKAGKYKDARNLIVSQARPEEYEEVYKFMYRNLQLWGGTEQKQDQATP